jgi:hypothetical protein
MTESCGCDVRSSLPHKVTGGLIVAVLLTAFLSFWLWHGARHAEAGRLLGIPHLRSDGELKVSRGPERTMGRRFTTEPRSRI